MAEEVCERGARRADLVVEGAPSRLDDDEDRDRRGDLGHRRVREALPHRPDRLDSVRAPRVSDDHGRSVVSRPALDGTQWPHAGRLTRHSYDLVVFTVLCGGVGAARLLAGLVRTVDPAEITAIVNVGDDVVMHGLHVSPDLDTITYTLAGLHNDATGWGTAESGCAARSVPAGSRDRT